MNQNLKDLLEAWRDRRNDVSTDDVVAALRTVADDRAQLMKGQIEAYIVGKLSNFVAKRIAKRKAKKAAKR